MPMRCLSAGLVLAVFAFSTSAAFSAPINDIPSATEFPDNLDPDALLVAHLRFGEIWSSVLSKETLVKVAKVEGGLAALLNVESTFRAKNGFWPGDFDSATLHVTRFEEE